MSLLEVILALSIFAGSAAVLGELVRIGARHAQAARDLSIAQIHCESKLAEILANIEPPDPVSLAVLDEAGEWLYSVDVAPLELEGLLEVTVTVIQDSSLTLRPVEFTLVRWMRDPDLDETTSE